MTVASVRYRGNQGSNIPNTVANAYSPAIWADCPLDLLRTGEISGALIEQNGWGNFPLAGTQTTEIGHSIWKVFATATGTIAPVSSVNSTEMIGAPLQFSSGATGDNETLSIAQSYPCFLMSGLTTNSGKLWFEVELAINTIAVSTLGWMAGLAETELWTLATGVPFNSGDAITNSASFIGFRKEEDGLGVVDTVYSDRATSFTNIGDAEGSMAANTFIKYGLVYDPKEATNCVTFYENGIALTTKFSRTNITDRTNLDANSLGIIISQINDSGASSAGDCKLWIRRVRCAQLGAANN